MGSVFKTERSNNSEGDMMRGREKVFTYAAVFVSSTGVKINTNGCVGD